MLNILLFVVARRVKYEQGALLGWNLQGKARITKKKRKEKTCASATLSIRIYTRTGVWSKYFEIK